MSEYYFHIRAGYSVIDILARLRHAHGLGSSCGLCPDPDSGYDRCSCRSSPTVLGDEVGSAVDSALDAAPAVARLMTLSSRVRIFAAATWTSVVIWIASESLSVISCMSVFLNSCGHARIGRIVATAASWSGRRSGGAVVECRVMAAPVVPVEEEERNGAS